MLVSPLVRAVRTAELAGLGPFELDADLMEWDYGAYEGLTTVQIREMAPGWSVFTQPCPGGETHEDVAARCDRVLARLDGESADHAVLVAHGHLLRALTARWLRPRGRRRRDAPARHGGDVRARVRERCALGAPLERGQPDRGATAVSPGVIRPIRADDVDELYAMLCELAEYERSLHEVRSTADDFRVALFGPSPTSSATSSSTTGPGRLRRLVRQLLDVGRPARHLPRGPVRPPAPARPGSARRCSRPSPRSASSAADARLEWWVLDWNEPSIGFYRSIGAQSMDEWTVNRLTDEPLRRMGGG